MTKSNPIQFHVTQEKGEYHLASTQDDNPAQRAATMESISGSKNEELATCLLTHVAEVISPNRPDWAFNQAAHLMNGLAPQDEQEGILVTQMAAVHMAAMHALARAGAQSTTLSGAELCINRATKLLNLYARQYDLLERKRNGNQTIQKVIVERVEVKDGGQAILGAISAPGGGGRQKAE